MCWSVRRQLLQLSTARHCLNNERHERGSNSKNIVGIAYKVGRPLQPEPQVRPSFLPVSGRNSQYMAIIRGPRSELRTSFASCVTTGVVTGAGVMLEVEAEATTA